MLSTEEDNLSLTYINKDLSDRPNDQSVAGSWSVSSSNESNGVNPKPHEPDVKPDHSVRDSQFDTPASQTNTTSNENSPDFSASQNSSDSGQAQTVPQIRLSGVNHDWTAGTHPAEHKYHFAGPQLAPHDDYDPFMASDRLMETRTAPQHSSETPSRDPPKPRFSLSDDEIEPAPGLTGLRLVQSSVEGRRGRHSQVIRKINSGFEILRPGSLSQYQTTNEIDSEQELENKRSSNPRKLFKKYRDSMALRESRFIEGT